MQHCKALNQVFFKRPTLLDDPINLIPFYCISFSLMIIKNWLISGYWIVEPRHIQPVSCYDNDTNVSFLQSIIQRTFDDWLFFFFQINPKWSKWLEFFCSQKEREREKENGRERKQRAIRAWTFLLGSGHTLRLNDARSYLLKFNSN